MLKVVNGKRSGFIGKDVIYIGRANRYHCLSESVLRNQFVIGSDGNRDEVIEKYRRWLWLQVKAGLNGQNHQVFQEIVIISQLVKASAEIKLACYCVPEKCHGDVIKRCIEWMIESGI
ncbi:DUF4326 domain-containing protein [Merismopedia glauca]|uniref:DUF4326 domain-containing protein n=1 Tax=Merismopedia glauca CCAP 1448/3 TaxID=1296344 RepID=A0A2T1BX48_9CYAN|nr:DUF4326 domain-containing protein [Merismopedia glauca]PSB00487.1 hypothetical protein C7B64_23280 [Merismopedia glauca CCAP 1448/3]